MATSFSSSLDALHAFLKTPDEFDLVLTDMTMPKMTGADLARQILATRPGTPIILCTGYSELINAEKAKEIGIRDYVMKPVVKRELATSVRRVLDQRKSDL